MSTRISALTLAALLLGGCGDGFERQEQGDGSAAVGEDGQVLDGVAVDSVGGQDGAVGDGSDGGDIAVNKTPTVTLLQPQDGATFNLGEEAHFEASVADAEDAELEVSWTSSVVEAPLAAGKVGSGGTAALDIATLPAGK